MGLHSKETYTFISLLTEHQTPLRAFIISLAPGCPDIDDILQNTNIMLWEKMAMFKEGSNFKAWAFAIARNCTLEHLRANKRNNADTLNEDVIFLVSQTWESLSENPNTSAQPENTRLQALDQCMASLPQNQRKIIQARYNKGTNLEMLGAQIGRTAESLRVTLHRIRIKLRECVRLRLTSASNPVSSGGSEI